LGDCSNPPTGHAERARGAWAPRAARNRDQPPVARRGMSADDQFGALILGHPCLPRRSRLRLGRAVPGQRFSGGRRAAETRSRGQHARAAAELGGGHFSAGLLGAGKHPAGGSPGGRMKQAGPGTGGGLKGDILGGLLGRRSSRPQARAQRRALGTTCHGLPETAGPGPFAAQSWSARSKTQEDRGAGDDLAKGALGGAGHDQQRADRPKQGICRGERPGWKRG